MRNTGLDLLRLLAVLLVLGRHLPDAAIAGPAGFRIWHTGGWVGVDLFFVLSGFLVSGLMFAEYRGSGQARVGRFLVRRGLKIFPAFWVLMAFTAASLWVLDQPLDAGRFVAELLFVQNYFPGYWNHTWTLAVEEHFYLLLAGFVAWRLRSRASAPFDLVPALFVGIAVFCLGARMLHLMLGTEIDGQPWMLQSHARIDSLMFGVLLSYLHHFKDLSAKLSGVPSIVLVAGGVALLSPAFLFAAETHRWIGLVGVCLFYLGSGSLVLAAVRLERTDIRPLRGLAALGAASYSIYLWHTPVDLWGARTLAIALGVGGMWFHVALYLFGSLAIGYLMNRIVEWPILRLRDRLFPATPRGPLAGS